MERILFVFQALRTTRHRRICTVWSQKKMCPLLSANCRMYPFYYQVTYLPLFDSHAFTDFISPKKKNVCRFKAVDWAPQCKRQYTTFAVTWTASLSWSVLHFFESLTEQPMVRLSLSSWHCSSAGCGCRTWPPDTEGSWKYIELGARTADKERSSTLG